MRVGYKTFSIETCALCYNDFEDIDMRISLCPCDDKHIICHACLERTFLDNIERTNWFELPKILCEIITIDALDGRGHQKCQLEYPIEELIKLLSNSAVDLMKQKNVLKLNYADLLIDPFTQNMMALSASKVKFGQDRLLQCPKCFWIIDYTDCENLGTHVRDEGRGKYGNSCPGILENGQKCGFFAQFTNFYIRNANNHGLSSGQMSGIGNRYHEYINDWEIDLSSCHGAICTYRNNQTNQVVTGYYDARPKDSIGIAPEIDLEKGRRAYARTLGANQISLSEQNRLNSRKDEYEGKLETIYRYSAAHKETYFSRSELYKKFFLGANPTTPDTAGEYNRECLGLIEAHYQKNLEAPPITPKSNGDCAMPMENLSGSASQGGRYIYKSRIKHRIYHKSKK